MKKKDQYLWSDLLPGSKMAGGIIMAALVLVSVISSGVAGDEFSPADNYLLDCGSLRTTLLDDGRDFISDSQSSYLSTEEEIVVSTDSAAFLPLHLSARIFSSESKYQFPVVQPGWHWLRLYFNPLQHKSYNLSTATFGVRTDDAVLLHEFSVKGIMFKEYLINIASGKLTLTFSPMKNSIAFINGIELVSTPDSLISHTVSVVPPGEDLIGLTNCAIEVSYRLNVGGPNVSPKNDTLYRSWSSDSPFMIFPQGADVVSVPSDRILYPGNGITTPFIAPPSVYSTADQMADSETSDPNFNLTWEMRVDPSFSYLIRLHFCDIVSNALNELYFNVYINGFTAVSELDLSTIASGLDVPYHKDFVLSASAIRNGSVVVQIGPSWEIQSNKPDAILNGLEVMKLSNSEGSLDGFHTQSPKGFSRMTKLAALLGLVFAIVALAFLLMRITRVQKRPIVYQKQKTLTSWLLSLSSNQFSFLSSKSKISTPSSVFDPGLDLGRCFTLSELRDATKSFNGGLVVGAGGFGKVYLGELDDGTKVAIKRGNMSSSQGIHEFQTEVLLLSKLRHRHLVPLIGYCDEQSEMILVYEYMANGPLRNHLYASNLPPLSWRQRLEICIGAAKGLHYLHTGSSQAIIHRDVKTTNILLDDNFVAKVSDFGLSKPGPASIDQTHVSTAVKGSFGYLDPEYFNRKRLTDKSDVYSFGVVLFEVLCARPALDPRLPQEQASLAEWAKKQNARGMIESIIDPTVANSIQQDSLIQFVDIAEKCVAEYGADRPTIGDVLWHLEYALQLQETKEAGEKESKATDQEMIVDIGDNSASGVAVYSPVLLQGR